MLFIFPARIIDLTEKYCDIVSILPIVIHLYVYGLTIERIYIEMHNVLRICFKLFSVRHLYEGLFKRFVCYLGIFCQLRCTPLLNSVWLSHRETRSSD